MQMEDRERIAGVQESTQLKGSNSRPASAAATAALKNGGGKREKKQSSFLPFFFFPHSVLL